MTKYEMVEHALIEDINNGVIYPGDKLPSEYELCNRFNISRNVVRQALRNLEAMGYTETRRGIGTFCQKKRPANITSTKIGFIGFFPHSYIFPRIIYGADSVLFNNGFHLLLGQSHYQLERERKVLQRFLKDEVAGIIMEPIYDGFIEHSNFDLINEIIQRGIPIVFIDNFLPGVQTTVITLDDYNAGYEAAKYLWEKGHRKIGLFYQSDYSTKKKRMSGAESFMNDQEDVEKGVFFISFTGQGEQSTAYEAAHDFLMKNKNKCSAVFCSSDEDAMQFIEVAEELDIKIPEDISIIGFDNWKASAFKRIGLTTFEHPSIQMGETAARNLIDLIEKQTEAADVFVTIKPRIIERTSVAMRS